MCIGKVSRAVSIVIACNCRLLLRPEAPDILSRGTSSGDDMTAYRGRGGDTRTARAAYGGGATRFLARVAENRTIE